MARIRLHTVRATQGGTLVWVAVLKVDITAIQVAPPITNAVRALMKRENTMSPSQYPADGSPCPSPARR